MEKVIEFSVAGNILRGIIHIPERSLTQKIGINLLNPGIKYRVGPHGLNVKLARHLCHQGYFVLRFDPTGVGDTEGDLPVESVAKLWFRVEQGLFRNDILAANQFFANNVKLDELYLMGLCGGAISAILAAANDKKVTHLILIDVPVTFAEEIKGDADFITSTEYANQIYSHYKTKLFNPKSWLRFFCLQSDYKAIGKTLSFKLKNIIKSNQGKGKFSIHAQNFNYLFLKAFEDCMAQNKQILFMCSGKSYTTGEFQELFQKNYLHPESPYAGFCEVAIIPEANHTYTLLEWQYKLFDIISDWLRSHSKQNREIDNESKYGKIQTLQHSFS
jgi:pimeloyl-ACP methyl ester carboxylesterase